MTKRIFLIFALAVFSFSLLFLHAQEINPDFDKLLQRAQQLEAENKMDDAISQYQLAYQIDSTHPVMLERLSNLYLQKENYQSLIHLLQPTPGTKHSDPIFYERLAQAYVVQGNASLAEQAYRQALALDANRITTLYDLALLLEVWGRTDEANELYRQVINRKPNHAAAYFQLGVIAYRENSLEKARYYFEQTILFDPTTVPGNYNLGLVHLDLERWEDARRAFRWAIQLQPDHALAYYQIGVSYEEQNFLKDALEHYEKAVALAPDWDLAVSALNETQKQILDSSSAERSETLEARRMKYLLGQTAIRSLPTSSPYASPNIIHAAGTPQSGGFNSQGLILQMGAALMQQWMGQAAKSQDDQYYQER